MVAATATVSKHNDSKVNVRRITRRERRLDWFAMTFLAFNSYSLCWKLLLLFENVDWKGLDGNALGRCSKFTKLKTGEENQCVMCCFSEREISAWLPIPAWWISWLLLRWQWKLRLTHKMIWSIRLTSKLLIARRGVRRIRAKKGMGGSPLVSCDWKGPWLERKWNIMWFCDLFVKSTSRDTLDI